jgi:hypothetical protein
MISVSSIKNLVILRSLAAVRRHCWPYPLAAERNTVGSWLASTVAMHAPSDPSLLELRT